MSKVGHLFSRSSLSRVGDRLAQRYRQELHPRGVQGVESWGPGHSFWERWGEEAQVSVRWIPKGVRKLFSEGSFWAALRSWALHVVDSCLQERGSNWHLYLLPFAKVSSMNVLPCGLHQRASDPCTVFYFIVKHSLFEVKSNLV